MFTLDYNFFKNNKRNHIYIYDHRQNMKKKKIVMYLSIK